VRANPVRGLIRSHRKSTTPCTLFPQTSNLLTNKAQQTRQSQLHNLYTCGSGFSRELTHHYASRLAGPRQPCSQINPLTQENGVE
ncbi:MAG: hypothetical protein KKC77_02765, partial [Proteobacteria bacterium]|nr:hypothetical protein [Pseudomonadota bacterium]